jgi:alkanesulfonate monooxygenase SsuD/methylene tetrahydromethanopterin reductase-like flavin-dependent oxidoreductase (luciferase family)
MNFGFFMMPVHHPTKGLPRTINEDMHTVILADELGFDEVWTGEHFTIPWENLPGAVLLNISQPWVSKPAMSMPGS